MSANRLAGSPIREWLSDSVDLLLLLLALLAAAPLLPADSLSGEWVLARDDLAPWLAIAVAAAAAVRGGPLGDGAHPQLRPRRSAVDALLQRTLLAATPLALGLLYEAVRASSGGAAIAAAGTVVGIAVLRGKALEEGRTGWEPGGGSDWLFLAFVGALAALAGLLGRAGGIVGPLALGLLCGTMFLGAGTVTDRNLHDAQRRAAGRRDGRPWSGVGFRRMLAAFGPSGGLAVVLLLHQLFVGPYTFSEAYAVTLHVVMWSAVLWPSPAPLAVQCVLHELRPTGGAEGGAGFEHPPEGALRLNPLQVARTRAVHLWLVPVQSGRVQSVDDPVALLWPPEVRGPDAHVLGDASFPTGAWGRPQRSVVRIRLHGQSDTVALRGGEIQARRLAVLQPWPRGGKRPTGTYRWDVRLRPGALQVVDAATEELLLTDGAILVLSSEGVARLYELEIGAPVFPGDDLSGARIPQLADYTAVGT